MTDAGPELLSVTRVEKHKLLRRVGNIYYNMKFANAFVVAAVQSYPAAGSGVVQFL